MGRSLGSEEGGGLLISLRGVCHVASTAGRPRADSSREGPTVLWLFPGDRRPGTVMGRERGSEPRAPEWRRDGQHGWPVQSRPALSRQRLRGRADAVASAAAGPWGCVGPGLGVPRLPFRAGQARTLLRSTHCLPLGSEGRACRPTDALTPGFGAWVDPALLASCTWSSELESPGQ